MTGPDEYSAIADNNIYTNLGAAENLAAAAELAARYPTQAASLGVDEKERQSWQDASDAVVVPFDERLGVHPQAEGFTAHEL